MKRKLPPLNALKAFEVAGRHQHFSKAGEELIVSHVAISRHVKELEQWLGIKLFDRTGRGVVLTDKGEQYLANLSIIFDDILAATKAVVEKKCENALRVTSDPALAIRWLIQNLKVFAKIQPRIQISVDPSEEVVNLTNSGFDVGIRFGSGHWYGVETIEIFRPNIFPVCSPEYLKKSKISSLADMATVDFLHDDGSSLWRDWLKGTNIRRKRNSSDATYEKYLALSAAESGLGFALGDELLCIEALKKGTLVRPLNRSVSSNKSYYMVFPKGLGDCEVVYNFAEWLSSEVNKSVVEFGNLNS